jgi:hypothetical protein
MKKNFIILLIAATVGAGMGAWLGYGPMLRYKSEGVLSLEMGSSEYKRFTELANDTNSAVQYFSVIPVATLNENNLDLILKTILAGDWYKPVPKVSKADAKELPDVLIMMERDREKEKEKEKEKAESYSRKDGVVYLGLRISSMANDQTQAKEVANLLGRYFKEVATREALRELVSNWAAENRQLSDRALEQQLKYKFEVEQAETRVVSLKKLILNNPNSVLREGNPVIEIRKENEKFISPTAQLVGAESQIIDIKEKNLKLERQINQQAFIAPLILRAQNAMKQTKSGTDSVNSLTMTLTEFAKNAKTDAEREKLLTLTADVSQISARFLSQAQFIAEPYLPTRAERPTPTMWIVLIGLLFLLLTSAYIWRDVLQNILRGLNTTNHSSM